MELRNDHGNLAYPNYFVIDLPVLEGCALRVALLTRAESGQSEETALVFHVSLLPLL